MRSYVVTYAMQQVEEAYGNQSVEEKTEIFIRRVAQELGIHEPIELRKFHAHGLQRYGYYNAIAAFPAIFYLFPLDKPCIFISTGFMEGLSSDEQRFLIGHELMHIKEKHPYYLLICYVLLAMFLVLAWSFFGLPFLRLFGRRTTFSNKILMGFFMSGYLIIFFFGNMFYLTSMRYNEYRADSESMKILKTFDGCCSLINRWKKDFNLPDNYAFNDFFSTHPSCYKRIDNCKQLQS